MRELRVNAGPLKKVYEDHLSVVYRRSGDAVKPTTTKKRQTETLKIKTAAETASSQYPQPQNSGDSESQFNQAVFQKQPVAALNRIGSRAQQIKNPGSNTKPTKTRSPRSRLFDKGTSSTSIFGD